MEVRSSFHETVPRKTAENTVKHINGGVGSVVANNHCGGESLLVVTTLVLTNVLCKLNIILGPLFIIVLLIMPKTSSALL